MIKKLIPVILAVLLLAGCSDDTSKKEETAVVTTEKAPEDKFPAGKYFSTGNTALEITYVEVYNSEYPGKEELRPFTPGSSMLINLWCADEARNNSVSYVVPAEMEHKSEYSLSEYLHKEDMFFYMQAVGNQYCYEFVIPEDTSPGNYELRFVCDGVEEGYFTFTVK